VLLFVEDDAPKRGIQSFAYAFHKAPIAYYTCLLLGEDYTSVVDFYTAVSSPVRDWNAFAVKTLFTTFFNWVDLMYEFLTLYYAWEDREWTEIGTYAAKIVSDIFFKAPFHESWGYNNSDLLNKYWGEPLDPWNGLIREINYLLAFFDVD